MTECQENTNYRRSLSILVLRFTVCTVIVELTAAIIPATHIVAIIVLNAVH